MEKQTMDATASKPSMTKEISITALFIALTLLFTLFVNVRLPIAANGGLIHLGNVPFLLAAIIYGKKTGAIVGGIGMGLFDVMSGWIAWAPCTLIVVGLMGFVVGFICERKKTIPWIFVSIMAALIIKVAGYYIYEAVMYHSFIIPLASIPGNVVQIGVAGVIVLLIITPLERMLRKLN